MKSSTIAIVGVIVAIIIVGGSYYVNEVLNGAISEVGFDGYETGQSPDGQEYIVAHIRNYGSRNVTLLFGFLLYENYDIFRSRQLDYVLPPNSTFALVFDITDYLGNFVLRVTTSDGQMVDYHGEKK